MNKYAKYKKVDLPWLEEVPEHWEIGRISRIFNLRKEKNNPIITKEVLALSAKHGVSLYSDKKEKGGNKPKEDLKNYNVCYPGDILVNCMNIVAGSVGISNYLGAVSPVYYPLVNKNYEEFSTKYMEYVLRTYNFQRSLVGLGKGIQMSESEDGRLFTVRMRISWDMLKIQRLPIPPLAEQEQIAAYLDWKINEIDRLINLEERKIEKIESIKISIVSEAVIGNLNKNVKFKEVNLPWVKKIPQHWKIVRGKNLYKKEKRPVREMDDVITCFRDGEVTLRKNRRTEGFTESILEHGYQGVRKGDLVIHIMDAFAGAIGVSDSDGKSTPAYNVCTSKIDLSNYYYAYLLRTMAKKGYIQSLYRGIRERSSDFRFDAFERLFLPVPPIEEQDKIVKFLDSKINELNNINSNLQSQISYLQELKQSLISEVVTGKIDVRNITIPNYTKVDTSITLDEEEIEE